ncbi:phage terminase large subunit [Comamonas sp. AG1104]|uniref:phage terminase large subunit n=1 Tax=Comamonas sp. AG1104 TaxID=2183900 RepID=UPI000E09EE0B|nr:phage terminase large subunit [Comamonas sp. AG1104]RDI10749.1 putative phage terminase large subunit-like protein [Comamonas sp. AG1104]
MAKNSKDFLAGLTALADDLRKQIDANLDGWDTNPAAIAERRRKVCDPVNGYEYWDRNYFPHYGRAEPSELHKYLYKRLPEIVNTAAGQRDAIAAPRGEAKSTKISMSFVSWCLVTGAKWYAIIVMDAFEQAAEMLEAIKAELEANPRIANDFPEACGQGRVWRAGVIVTANGRKVEAFGSSKKIRGRRHGAHRPDLAICDDIENDENVNTPAQRDKLQAFVTKSVLSLGPPDDSMDAILVGTVLHYDSVLARFLKNPLWNRKVFKAIIQWPERMDLWEQFEGFLLNADTPQEGEAAAMALYREHQAEMEKGSKVSWPALRPLVKLMIRRAREGHSAFDSEQQNDPTAGEDAPFANSIRFWVNRLAEWVFYGACDPSLGRAGNSRDPSAIGVGGYNRETGIMDVVEAAIRKRVPDRIISDVIEMQREYCCIVWGFESVQFQEFLRTELVKRSAQQGVPVPARPLLPISDKLLRIESLQPHMHNGLIRVHSSQTTLIDQFRHFPKADHDDGPDMVQMLYMLAVTGGIAAATQGGNNHQVQTARERYARQASRMFRRNT